MIKPISSYGCVVQAWKSSGGQNRKELKMVCRICGCKKVTCRCRECLGRKSSSAQTDGSKLETGSTRPMRSGAILSTESGGLPEPVGFSPEGPDKEHWQKMFDVAVKAQSLITGAVPTGGFIAAFYAGHRVSFDVDYLLINLKNEFDSVLETLADSEGWEMARKTTNKVILGSLDGIEVGYRQLRRTKPMRTTTVVTKGGKLVVPTFGECLNAKAAMTAIRGKTRDFLDVAALSIAAADDEAVLDNLLRLDSDFAGLQSHSIALSVAQALCNPQPDDLGSIDLKNYKGLTGRLSEWSEVDKECRRLGQLLTKRLAEPGKDTK